VDRCRKSRPRSSSHYYQSWRSWWARERERQRLVSTPLCTPQHTVKKTYVVDTLCVDLIERYAKEEGLELKDVVNLAFHEFFERRHYLPEERNPS